MDSANSHLDISYRRSKRAKNLRITINPTQAITVTIPKKLSLERAKEFVETKQAWIQKHLRKIRQQEKLRSDLPELSQEQLDIAQDQLLFRLECFAQQHQLVYNKVSFRCQKTRWGSCSSQNNISLNINLAFLPRYLQDYVLLHELCHIRHKNHSKDFWTQLNEYCDDCAKELAKELKSYPVNMMV